MSKSISLILLFETITKHKMFGTKITLTNRIPGLDLARAIAICLVVFAHSLWISGNYPESISWLMQLSGTIGVEIFFVISGFLIGKIIYKIILKDDFSLKDVYHFWVRRWFRTLPNYYFILILNIVLWFSIYKELPEKIILYFFYLQNLTTTSPAFFRISWSLAVEQFCYIIGPLSLFFLIRIFPKKDKKFLFLVMSLIIILIFIFIRIRLSMTHTITSIYQWNESLRKVTLYRLDAIYYGFVAYYFINKYKSSVTIDKILFCCGSISVLFLNFFIFNFGISVERNPEFFIIYYLPLHSISICFLLPFLITLKIQSNLFLKWITLISVLSYSIYLLHYTIILHGMKTIFPSDSFSGLLLLAYTLIYWFLVLVFSYLQYRFFEKPMTDLRDKN